MDRFWLAFIPLFVAIDVLGVLPIYWSLAHNLPKQERRQAVLDAVVVAFLVAQTFLLVSGMIFKVLGILMADVLIAGGAILFTLSVHDLLNPDKTQYGTAEALGVVPLGVPLLVGPAVLTTVLLVRERYGVLPTVGALSFNILLAWAVLWSADYFMGWLGKRGARVVSKVFNLLLAAYAVMLMRQGLQVFFHA